jgi:Tol biopolymer transport system component
MVSSLIVACALALTDGDEHAHCGCGAFLPEYDAVAGMLAQSAGGAQPDSIAREVDARETGLANLRQLTFGGQNAEAYWNREGTMLVYQARLPGYPDEQIFLMNQDGSGKTLVSTGKGRCTCAYFSPDGAWLYFSSTHEKNEGPQKPLDMSKGYLWMVNPDFALYRVRADAVVRGVAKPERVLRLEGGYVAETTIAPNGKFMTFTAEMNGDLDVYRARLDGTGLTRLTDEVGYDGGPFVSWDSRRIVWRRDKIESDSELADYRALLAEHLVRPGKLEIWIMDADGRNKRQVTRLGAASFAPFLHPDGRRIIFSSNYGDPRGREFDLWMVNVDGGGLRRVTHTPEFDGFPMFSRDGKKLVWASNRFGTVRGETNIFVADWKD